LPTIFNKNNNIVLYADDISVIITYSDTNDFNFQANLLFNNLNTCFKNNILHLNLGKNYYLEFQNRQHCKSMDKYITKIVA
jgi:hypothetical protein